MTELTALCFNDSRVRKAQNGNGDRLAVSGNIEHFAIAKAHGDKAINIRVTPDLTKKDIYLRQLLPRWDEMSHVFGGAATVLERLQIMPEITLRSLYAGIPSAKRLFDL